MTTSEQTRAGLSPRSRGLKRRGSVTDGVIDAIVSLLRSGRYRSGDRLPSEWELVKQLGVGRSAVREALRELSALDLVDVQPGRGTFVANLRPDLLVRPDAIKSELDRALVGELLEVRQIIEPEAAALATVRATSADLDRLAHDVDRLAEAVDVGYAPPEDLGFHVDILRATRNTALTRLAGAVVGFYQRYALLPTTQDVVEHGAILHAMQHRDAQAARSAMSSHLHGDAVTGGLQALATRSPSARARDR
jgi:GntR family transcriptional regulator, transcriptional repressor for pyruvate dehydrogenase complex